MKIAWIDCETTGLNSWKHAAIQWGVLLEVDREIVDILDLKCRPFDGAVLEQKAMEVHGYTVEQLAGFPEEVESFVQLKRALGNVVNPFEPNDKFVIANFNVNFDIQFLRAMFARMEDKFFGSWFHWPSIDVQFCIARKILEDSEFRLKSYNLKTVCAHFDINLDNAHDAVADAQAARNLFYTLGGL